MRFTEAQSAEVNKQALVLNSLMCGHARTHEKKDLKNKGIFPLVWPKSESPVRQTYILRRQFGNPKIILQVSLRKTYTRDRLKVRSGESYEVD